ncbi:MAG: Crp/Fnr family transcriptional regulator [Nitrosomonadales bacterium]|nr:Crp/Fnr family transcriptional regulator [Nitrosomonadales bacterium]
MNLPDGQHNSATQPGNAAVAMHMMGHLITPDERILRALHNSRLAEGLSDPEISVLTRLITVQTFEVRELAELDDDPLKDALMVLVDGEVEINALVGNEPVSLHLVWPGDLARIVSFVGGNMMSLNSRIIVRRDSTVLLLQRSRLESLLHTHPAIVYGVMRNLVLHLHGMARQRNAEKEELKNYFFSMHGRY